MSFANLSARPEPRVAFDRISVRRLVLIRWVAITGQALTLLIVHYALDFRLPLLPALGVVACSVLLNLWFRSIAAPPAGSASARPPSSSATTCCNWRCCYT